MWLYQVLHILGTLLETLGDKGGITLAELQRSAVNVLRFVMDSTAFKKRVK